MSSDYAEVLMKNWRNENQANVHRQDRPLTLCGTRMTSFLDLIGLNYFVNVNTEATAQNSSQGIPVHVCTINSDKFTQRFESFFIWYLKFVVLCKIPSGIECYRLHTADSDQSNSCLSLMQMNILTSFVYPPCL